MKFKASFILCFILISSFAVTSCKKKEKPQEAESSAEAKSAAPSVIPEPEPGRVESDSFEDHMVEEAPAPTPAEDSKENVTAKPEKKSPPPQVDPSIITQRLKTYRADLDSQAAKIKKFEEMQQKFAGDDEEFDSKFEEAVTAYREEQQRFDKLLKSLRRNPSLLQWESKEREWADEWRHVVRSFNDVEALYEKQYEGLK